MSDARILVVDDEVGVRDLLTDALQMQGYGVVCAPDGLEAWNLLRRANFDLVISDVNMPKLDGISLLKKLRIGGDSTPVLLLTARDQRQDVTHGLREGADDYLTKPFGLEELVLRVAAILRRTANTESNLIPTELSVGAFRISDETHEAFYGDEALELSPTEFRLLSYLLEHAGKVVSKQTLLSAVWGMDASAGTGVVDTYVSYLRRKLAAVGFKDLATVRGVGVRLLVQE